MKAVIMRAPGDIVVEEVPVPHVAAPGDAVIKLAAACICGSDLWPFRGLQPVENQRMGHEYVGTVVEVGEEVSTLKVGDFVIGSFMVSDSTCEICQAGFPSHCANAGSYTGSQADYMRIEQADGTLVVVPGGAPQDPERLADYLAASDVLGTGWFSAVAAQAGPGKTIAVVGDGAVGLSAVLAAKTLGAEKVIAFSRHEDRAQLAREFGADVVIAERGEEGAAKVKELTGGLGTHGVCEAVGTQESMDQALASCRPGGYVGFVGVSHDQKIDGQDLFFRQVHLLGGPAPVRRFLPDLIQRIQAGQIHPGKVFTSRIPLEQAAEGYKAMDERREIKVMLEVCPLPVHLAVIPPTGGPTAQRKRRRRPTCVPG
ncbi:MAG: zinc-binding dehydrogenase [Actinomyces urogenitalis]|uniref:zinc-binding dehydrogenase n=1 Tax=Actinomyces urogenitalis TaxID=103621 RepID=UPI002903CBC7|nr:zinc-binding dehydrogenase [Actinomyces urogenitalis]MDU0972772.1 zinc-binding dehydrogenase [Actinomyces urogenitalis]MDU6151946.1 zinc-binding dehydrogenase [Actinomyces urogenitalis]